VLAKEHLDLRLSYICVFAGRQQQNAHKCQVKTIPGWSSFPTMPKAELGRISREAARIMGPAFLVSVSVAAADTAAAAALA
jgi:hypothetical protein